MDLKEEIDETESSDGLLGQPREPLRKRHGHQQLFLYLLLGSASLNISLIGLSLGYWVLHEHKAGSSYENGFSSELGPARSQIELTEQVFTGEIRLDTNGNYFMDRKGQQYAGKPSPEIDDAWNEILDGLNIGLNPLEADLGDTTFRWPGSGDYFTGLEVFHSLHCLNRVRQALYPEYYPEHEDPRNPSLEDHLEHCINHLRQVIQCHSDLTPMQWYRADNRIILRTETRHTCRNFEKIHDWAKQKKSKIHDSQDIEAVKNGDLFIVD